jgi:hypothetical protein
MKIPSKLVYIIILNWNGCRDAIECIESCQKLAYPAFRILVVDNGSTDGSPAIIRKRFPDIGFIQNNANLGYAGGNNAGIEYALAQGAEYVWLLNNDSVVDSLALTELVNAVEAEPAAGMAGSLILYYDKPDLICFAGGFLNWQDGATLHLGKGECNVSKYDTPIEVEFVSGCSILVSRGAVESVGMLNEDYFLYYEETDWCARALRVGLKNLCVPGSKVYHKESPSTGAITPDVLYYMMRNRLFFLERNGRQVKWLRRFVKDIRLLPFEIIKNRDYRLKRVVSFCRAYLHWINRLMGPVWGPVRVGKQ